MRWRIASLMLGLAMSALANTQAVAQPFDVKDPVIVAKGQALFNGRCAGRCHGVDGTEGEAAPILRGREYLTAPFVFATLLSGRPRTAMPSWADRYSTEELWQLAAFVASLN